jgi:hypothetical protein
MEEARGLETYCLSPRGAASTSSAYLTRGDIQKLPGNDYDTQNILLASMVHSEIIKLNPGDATADRGVKRARFVVIKQNVLPAILVEGGFVSNHMEAARVNRPDYRQSLAQAIARGVIRFVNVMGDRHLQLPGMSPDRGAPAPVPRPIAVEQPPAPSGLAHDPANGRIRALGVSSSATATSPAAPTATISIHKSKKKKKTVASSLNSATKPEADNKSSASTPGGALNLSEPATPAPSPGAEKAPPEPDEPPTVTIYSADSPGTATSSASTNANASPVPPSTHHP